ncbi:MAG: sigma-54-dependent Fis family transcriptional regulator [Deltaproteobacteria bacterium]|nr:sigma-54-dependent Fis family transcriptional regulator [Deltaproteobacteria bacterium]
MANILVVDDERSMREFLQILLEREGHVVTTAASVKQALQRCGEGVAELVFVDLKLPDGSGMEVLAWLKEHEPDVQVIMMTAFATTETAVGAMRIGAYDYQLKPFKVEETRALTQKALEKLTLLRENRALRAQLKGDHNLAHIVGKSTGMAELMALLAKVAPTPASVLIEGESGTGKELVARAIHAASPRHAGPFVAVNCGAIPETLLESELFGHAAGAFTGANRSRPGLFETATAGTLLFDEIGELPLSMQVKLLRVLQERKVRRVGEEHERPVDVRVLAATNHDLQARVQAGRFREDLFYRLNVVRLRLPPLRERQDDIPTLARAFVLKYAESMGKEVRDVAPETVRALCGYRFPGNVRELQNLMERAVILAGGDAIQLADLPEEVRGTAPLAAAADVTIPEGGIDFEATVQGLERRLLKTALTRAGGVKTRAAELLGLSLRSLRYRLQKLGLQTTAEPDADSDRR